MITLIDANDYFDIDAAPIHWPERVIVARHYEASFADLDIKGTQVVHTKHQEPLEAKVVKITDEGIHLKAVCHG